MYNFLLSKGNALLKNSILYKYVIIENQMKRKPSFWNTAKFLISILFEIERTNVFFLEKKRKKLFTRKITLGGRLHQTVTGTLYIN